MPDTITSSKSSSNDDRRLSGVPHPNEWKVYSYRIEYRNKSRITYAFIPFEESALDASGVTKDEEIKTTVIEGINAMLIRATTRNRPKVSELMDYYSEMGRALRSQIPPMHAIKVIIPMIESPYFRGVLSGILYLMSRGNSLAQAMSGFPEAFDQVAISLLSAGEKSNTQPDVFDKLVESIRFGKSIKGKFIAALVVPCITFLALIVGGLVLHFFALPSIVKSFSEIKFGKLGSPKLPLPTEICWTISSTIKAYPILYAVPIIAILLIVFMRRPILESRLYQENIIKIPILGRAVRYLILSRCLNSLAMLYGAKTDEMTSFRLTSQSAANIAYKEFFESVYNDHIKYGRTVYHGFMAERYRIGPEGKALASRMEVAASTGDIKESLAKTAQVYQETSKTIMNTLPALLGPACTVIAAPIVLLYAAAVFSPNITLLMNALSMTGN